jgi:mRNA-degrading endonuclease RelE of RelBE toxin-antitoxin system
MNSSRPWVPRKVEYKPHALRSLRRLGREDGERVRLAVGKLANTGRGDVKPVEPREMGFPELRVGLHLRAYFRYEGETLTVYEVERK